MVLVLALHQTRTVCRQRIHKSSPWAGHLEWLAPIPQSGREVPSSEVIGFEVSITKGESMRQKGFSLIELLIVVAIILIIAAIAIPNLLRSRIAANEASAVGSLRTMNTAMVSYASTYPALGFPSLLISLQPAGGATPNSTQSDLLDQVLSGQLPNTATPNKSGYTFTYTAGAPATSGIISTYGIQANPITQNTTGIRSFATTQSGVIYDCAQTPYTGDGTTPPACSVTQ